MTTISKPFSIKSILICCIFFSVFTHQSKSEELKYVFEGITNDKGLTHNTVFDICQDDKGFMWFATDGGLNRYDGQNIKQYFAQDNNRSLPSNSIPSLLYTSDNKLFVGSFNGLALYQPETDDFQSILYNDKALKGIIRMQQGLGAEILISTENNGAFIYNYENKVFTRLTFLKERIFGMTVDKDTIPTFDYIIEKLSKDYDLAYIHLSEPFNDVSKVAYAEPHIAKRYRPKYKGTLIINGGFDEDSGNKIIADGYADLVSFAKLYISNPDLVGRFKEHIAISKWDTDTFYTLGKEGYTTYEAKT